MSFVKGFCTTHPSIKAAPGHSYKCASCAGISSAPIPKARSCVNHKDRPIVDGSIGFCAECQAASDLSSEIARKAREAAAPKRGRPADPVKVQERADAKVQADVNRAKREAEKAAIAEKAALLPRGFHSYEQQIWSAAPPIPVQDVSSWLRNQTRIFAQALCRHCGRGKKGHGEARSASPGCANLPLTGSKIVPILVLGRTGNVQEACRLAENLPRDSWRNVQVSYLPRAHRNKHDLVRAQTVDPIVGCLLETLDSQPFAIWIPLDPDHGGKVRNGSWQHETLLAGGGMIVADASPPERCDPSHWLEISSMHGAEILDLRNYPEVLNMKRDEIALCLKEAHGWERALRTSVAMREGRSFYQTAKKDSQVFYSLRDVARGTDQNNDPPAQILVGHNIALLEWLATEKE